MPNIRQKRYNKPATPAEFALVSQYYERKKWEFVSGAGNMYIGYNLRQDASVDDTDWLIQRIVQDANDDPEDYQSMWGSWSGRAGLSWVNPDI